MNASAIDELSRTTYKLTPMTAVLGVEMLHRLLPPVAIAPAIEHFGDILTIGSVTGRKTKSA